MWLCEWCPGGDAEKAERGLSSSAALLFTLMVSRCRRVTGALQDGEAALQQAGIKAPLSDGPRNRKKTGVCFVSEGRETLINDGIEL